MSEFFNCILAQGPWSLNLQLFHLPKEDTLMSDCSVWISVEIRLVVNVLFVYFFRLIWKTSMVSVRLWETPLQHTCLKLLPWVNVCNWTAIERVLLILLFNDKDWFDCSNQHKRLIFLYLSVIKSKFLVVSSDVTWFSCCYQW